MSCLDEFWSEQATQASWEKLKELQGEFEFTLIGGWAVFVWTKAMKSKDIDFIVDFETLGKLKSRFPLQKNERLRKYEIKFRDFDVDVYATFYSKLALPPEKVLSKYSAKREGFTLATPEALLVLKQGAEIDRRHSVKGRKDSIDILSLCLKAGIDWRAYKKILRDQGIAGFARELAFVITSFPLDDLHYLGLNLVEFKKWKKKTLAELKA
ncbi:MAG TPA: hypothetical protein VI875_00380 [Candidatus Norongarragalinales archaeon]|nr:hypothetical protein [Candidatus Norongarragalinales archaeon]